jgi:Holliday junction resolvase
MPINSRTKGAVGEREWAKVCRDEGFDARRGQQFKGTKDSPDVVSEDLCMFHAEVKRVQKLNLQVAMDKAIQEAEDLIPYVAHRRNHCDWLVTMKAEDWFKMVREFV